MKVSLWLLVAALLIGLGVATTPAQAVSVSTNDGVTLTLNSDGSWNNLTVNGTAIPTLGGVTGGFVLYPTDGIIIPWQRNTFYTGTPVRGSATQNGSNINFSGSANGINFNITLTGGLPYIKVDGTATGGGTDHSFILYFRIPVDANGWKWWDHINASRTIANGAGNWYFVNSHFHQARHPDLSDNPFGAITKTTATTMGLSLTPVFYPPQAYAIQYNSQGGLWIEIEMGVTSRTTRHPNQASFSFLLYQHDPAWGDRSAVARVYSFFPAWFTKISPGGNWLVDYGYYPSNPSDFAIKYLETNNFATSWADTNSIYACKYNEAWCYHWGSTDTNYLEQRAQDNSNNWGTECTGKGQSYCEAAQAIILSGMKNYNGSYVGPDDPARWTDGSGWGCGETWRYITDPDPDLPNWRNFTLNGGAARNRGQSDKYWEWYSSWGNFPTGGQHFTGLYHDSTAGGWCGWGSVHDFETNHWGTYDFSPVPCGDSAQGAPGAVSMWGTFHFIKFAKYAHDQMVTENRPVMGNGGPSYEMYAIAPWLDFFGVGEYYDGNIKNLSISRMIANQRGCSYLYGAQSQAIVLQTLLMDVYPGMGDGSNAESLRSMYQWLMPIFNALDQAGWQPITDATTSNGNFYLERYGPASTGTIYIAAQPTTTGSTTITVQNAPLGWPANPDVTVSELVYGGAITRSYDGSGNLTITTPSISANDTRVYKIVPNWSSGTQVSVYPDAWESYTNAPTTITSGSLTSVQADDSNYMVMACDPTSHKFSSHYTWHSGYAPANVTRLTLTYKAKNSASDTPSFNSWIKQENNGTWTSILNGSTWSTSDQTMTWTTTNTAAYMSPSGVMEINFCGCPINSNNYSHSANLVKIDLWVLGTAPTANFTGSPTSGGQPLAVTFTDTSTGSPTSWSWTFGDGNTSTAHNPSHTYNSAGAYTVALTATNGGGSNTNTKTGYINVYTAPTANFTGNPTSGANPLAVAFTDTSTGSPTSWSWTFGDGNTSTAQNPSHTYSTNGSFTVALTATNAYGTNTNTKTNYISVATPPVANFSGTPTSGAPSLVVAFTDSSTNSPTSWSWTFGDSYTSTTRNPSHTYTAAGSYTVALTAMNAGGSNTNTKTGYITVAVAPVANFTGTPTNGQEPLAVTFTDTSTNSPTSWSWTFGDGSTSTTRNPSHTYTNAGSYTVALTATNVGGSNTKTQTGYINVTTQSPVASFTGTPTNGPTPLVVQFTDTSTNVPTSWAWTFGDGYGSNLQNPSHTYATAGDYTVSLTATNSGGNNTKTLTNYIAVANAGEVFAYPDTITTFPNPGVTLISGILADLKTDDGIYQVYRCDTTNQRYEVMYTADTPYTPGQVTKITVEYQAKVSRSDTPASGSVFIRQSNGSWPFIASWKPGTSDTDYSWNSTAVSTYMDSNGVIGFELCTCPTGGNTNNYDISSDKMRFRLQLATPVANFTSNVTSGLKTLAVNFTDTSTNSPTSWSWAFGDGGTSTAHNPSHSYTTQGLYNVSLTATNAVGSNTMTKSNYIRVFREVSTYPSSWNTYTNAPSTLIAGGLSNLQADDSSYMQIRCDTASHKYSAHYVWSTSYAPSHVGNVILDYNGKNSLAITPSFLCWIKKQTDGTWTSVYEGLWTTTDKTISWSAADSSYISSGGQMEINFCGCPQNSSNYDQYADLVRIKLWLDN